MRRLALAALALLLAVPAAAQEFPGRVVSLVVLSAAGGANDTVARVLAEALTARLPHPVIVENRPGGQGMLGVDAVLRAPPDGHVLMFSNTGQAAMRVMAPDAPIDVPTALTPVAVLTESPMVMLVANNVPARDLREFLALARAEPGRFDYATASGAGTLRLAAMLFSRTTGLEMNAVPYRGAGPALIDLIAGRIAVMFDPAATGLQTARGGQARAFAVSSRERSPFAPEVPTWREMGVEADMTVWLGVWSAASTPRRIREAVHAAIAGVLRQEGFRARMAEFGADRVLDLSLDETEAYVAAEVTRWEAVFGLPPRPAQPRAGGPQP